MSQKQTFFIVLVLVFLVGVQVSASALEREKQPSILDSRIASFKVKGVDMEEALVRIHQLGQSKLLIGFEKVAHPQGEKDTNLSLELANTTVSDILAALCKLDPRYTYEVVDSDLINVYPVGAKQDMSDLLNIQIKQTSISGKEDLGNIIYRLPSYVTELGSYLEEKKRAYSARTGVPYATLGADMRGDMSPEVDIQLPTMSVREILNSLVLYSVKLYSNSRDFAPLSWKYEFVIDPNASTGLGGYPTWGLLGSE
jgi:hypothetical protein